MKPRLLFVDDEPRALEGLKRTLGMARPEWDMRFAACGSEALQMLAADSFDLVVSDMRMPGMDGLQFLSQVRKRHPDVVRFMLSAYPERPLLIRAMEAAHQFFSKPSDANTILEAVSGVLAWRDGLRNSGVRHAIGQLSALPLCPSVYAEVLAELGSPEASIKRLRDIMVRDPALTVKILQLANSSFFLKQRAVAGPAEALNLLGLETVRLLVSSLEPFVRTDGNRASECSLEQIRKHNWLVGFLAERLACEDGGANGSASEAFSTGLLHDLGKLVFAFRMPQTYAEVSAFAEHDRIPLPEAERWALGTTHAEAGAYLLGIWGLPDAIVETAAFHHHPSDSPNRFSRPLAAVHAADALLSEGREGGGRTAAPSRLDIDFMSAVGKLHRVQEWRKLCASDSAGCAVA